MATAGVALLQVPPAVALLNVVVDPAQSVRVPVIAAGSGFTVTVAVTKQPVGKVYEITEVPADTPVTTPVDELTVATAGVALLQVPPAVALLNVVVDPAHSVRVPVIAAGRGLTVTVAVRKHPVGSVYDITEVPDDTPVTTPVAGSTVATAGVALLHVPPAVASPNVVVDPTHTERVPVIAAGNGLTVTVAVREHPVGKVYDITEVPAETPVTTPVDELTVATAGVALLQVPPAVALLNVVVDPTQTDIVPVITAGSGLIVIE